MVETRNVMGRLGWGFVVFLMACGGSTPPPAAPASGETASTATAAATAPAAGGDKGAHVWRSDMGKEEKVAYMKAHVVPSVGAVFKAKDAQHYESFGCKTCHGPNYKDPKEFLPKLVMKEGKMLAFSEKPEVSAFMKEKVVPAMAAAMGQKPYDPATHQGFGCMGCHGVEQR